MALLGIPGKNGVIKEASNAKEQSWRDLNLKDEDMSLMSGGQSHRSHSNDSHMSFVTNMRSNNGYI